MRGPKRSKRLYRVVIAGIGYSVLHFQDYRAAAEAARSRAKNGIQAWVYESEPIRWQEAPRIAYGEGVPNAGIAWPESTGSSPGGA